MKMNKLLPFVLIGLVSGSAFAAQTAPVSIQTLAQDATRIAHTQDAQQREKLLQAYMADMKSYQAQYQKMMSGMNMGGQ